jgi:hypothetical protein
VTRMIIARVLVVLAALFAVLSLLAGFIRFQALDNETFEQTASDLIADDEVRNQLALTLVDELYASVDVSAELENRLPPDLQQLAPAIAAALREFGDRAAVRVLDRPGAQAAWVGSVSAAHEQLLRVLDDKLTFVETEGGVVILNLRPLMIQIGDDIAIVGNAAERLPEDAGRVEIMQADQLERAQDLTRLLKFLGSVLWIVPFALAALAIWLAGDRKRDIVRMLALGSIVTGVLVLVVRGVAGNYVVDELVKDDSVRPAVADAWDIITAQLTDGGRTLVGIGIVLLAGVWLAGTTRSAVAARMRLAPWLERPDTAFGVPAAAFLLLVWWGPTVQLHRWWLVLTLAVILGIGVEAIRRVAAADGARAVEPVPAPDKPAVAQPGS